MVNWRPVRIPKPAAIISPACPQHRCRRHHVHHNRDVEGVAAGLGTMNDQTPDIIIGEQPGWGDPQPFGIAAVDERQHLYIIGKTGSGKTTLLRNLILQHIALGHGVGVIDPHGDLAEELLNHIPPKRANHLVYFNPGDLEFPIGLNVIGSGGHR